MFWIIGGAIVCILAVLSMIAEGGIGSGEGLYVGIYLTDGHAWNFCQRNHWRGSILSQGSVDFDLVASGHHRNVFNREKIW